MTKEQKATWSAALRSGKWLQARGELRKDGRFCCIGVAHEVLIGPIPAYMDTSQACGVLGITDKMGPYIEWNDKRFLSFPEIADRLDAEKD